MSKNNRLRLSTESLVIDLEKSKGKKDISKLTPVRKQITRGGKTFQTTVYVAKDKEQPKLVVKKKKQPKLVIREKKPKNARTFYIADENGSTDKEFKEVEGRNAPVITGMRSFAYNTSEGWTIFHTDSGMRLNPNSYPSRAEAVRETKARLKGKTSWAKKHFERLAELNPSPHLEKELSEKAKRAKYRKQVQDLRDKHGKDKLMSIAKDNGITWNKSDNAGVNYMRAAMAIREHLEKGNSISTSVDLDKVITPEDLKPGDKIVFDRGRGEQEATFRRIDLIGRIGIRLDGKRMTVAPEDVLTARGAPFMTEEAIQKEKERNLQTTTIGSRVTYDLGYGAVKGEVVGLNPTGGYNVRAEGEDSYQHVHTDRLTESSGNDTQAGDTEDLFSELSTHDDDELRKEALTRLTEIESRIRTDELESVYIVDGSGNVVYMNYGDKNSVHLSDAVESDLLEGMISTHNHPSDSSFSLPDASLLIWQNLSEMRAVGDEHDNRLRMPKGLDLSNRDDKLKFYNKVKRLYDREMNSTERSNRFWAKINTGEIDRRYAQKQHTHEVWEIISKETGMRYERTKITK